MPLVLLDSDAAIDFLRGIEPSVRLLESLTSAGDIPGICDVVVAEVYSGLPVESRSKVAGVLSGFAYLDTSVEAARQAGEWRYEFARRGVVLAISDVLVAATALAHQARLLTGNVAHYPMAELTLIPLPRPHNQSRR